VSAYRVLVSFCPQILYKEPTLKPRSRHPPLPIIPRSKQIQPNPPKQHPIHKPQTENLKQDNCSSIIKPGYTQLGEDETVCEIDQEPFAVIVRCWCEREGKKVVLEDVE
jgi:hypothetical protein